MQRWPLYLRQVKQILRSVDESFDERRYGFTGIVEALRYCQREGLFRLDRDRQGVLRVYPGPVLQRASTAAPQQAIDTDGTPAGVAAVPLEDDDNRGNRIESGDRYERGGRGGRDRGDREERAARGDRTDRGDAGERGDRTRRDERSEFGEPLVPGTLELFPLTEASADADADGSRIERRRCSWPADGRHHRGIARRRGRVGSPAGSDGDTASATGKRKRTGRGGGRTAKKTAAKPSSKSGKSAAPAPARGGKARCRETSGRGRKILLEAASREEHARPQGREILGRLSPRQPLDSAVPDAGRCKTWRQERPLLSAPVHRSP